jgi:hypothetical protein
MTHPGRVRPRSRRWAGATCLVLLLGLLVGPPAAAEPRPASAPPFNLDTGNAALQVVYPAILPRNQAVSPTGADATLVVDYTMLLEVSWFDAIAPYHPTAVGINSNLGRRPASEATTRNRNIAIIYASYQVLSAHLPQFRADWRAMVTAAGLDPDDTQQDTTTAVGIGNLAGRKVIENRTHDGLNRFGEESGRYNQQRYADYTGYRPVNTAYQLPDPSRWQPTVVPAGNGIFTVQQFVTPQMGRTRPYSYRHPSQFTVAPPRNSDHLDQRAYQRQADEVLRASARLTDQQKIAAEFFNNKFLSLGETAGAAALQTGNVQDVEKTVHYIATAVIADFDVTIATWYFKRRFDTVRPISAIRHLYGDQPVTAWGGPGKGTVTDIPASQWRPYLNTADHPEYPSGSASLCLSFAEASRSFFGTDTIRITHQRPAGSSAVEPGVTPATDLTLTWNSWSEFAADCGMSRLWAGVHFRSAIEEAASYAPAIGRGAYEFVQRHLRGEV